MALRLSASCLLPLLALFAAPAFAQDAGPAPEVPDGWTCAASYYSADDGCDCGCGVADPDCGGDASLEACRGDGFEWCDEGLVPVEGANHTCEANVCGDAWPEGDEACDDGNTADGDGCSADCLTIAEGYACPGDGGACRQTVCGDSIAEGSETCDDGNATASDGCSDTCTIEDGYLCPEEGMPCRQVVCGDGVWELSEDCDDGNATAGDGCSDTCTVEEGYLCTEEGMPCVQIPAGWTCDPDYVGDGDCDCGCGALDVDCPANATAADCDYDFCGTGEVVDPADITQCIAGTNDDAGPGPGDDDDAGTTPAVNDDAGPGDGENQGADAGPGGDDDTGSSCSASTVTTHGAPLSLALLGLVGLALVRRRR